MILYEHQLQVQLPDVYVIVVPAGQYLHVYVIVVPAG